ncbi:hypothetical protein FRC03_004224 [Tulasnella sp. 419]|nr:hypothetical protein FRC03_004224 [Tulasnella sp. 419]
MSVRTVGSRSGSLENLLSNCPHLQDLKLDDYQGPRLPTFFSPGFLRVELPFLRYLEVSYMCHDVAWTILTQWTIPQLTTLKLKAAPRPSGGERLQTTLLPLLSSVEHLHITGLGANKILVGSLFMSAPGLKTLAICDSSVNVRRAVSLMSTQGLSALSSDSSFTPPHPLPLNSLTALSIQTYADPAVENSNSGNGEIVTSRKAHLRRADGLKMTIEERRLTLKRVRVSDSSLVRKRLKQSLGEAGMKDIVIFHSTWNVPPLAKESGGPSNHE